MLEKLTEKQEEVLKVIIAFWKKNDSVPQRAELGRIFGWTSPRSAPYSVGVLVKKGWLTKTDTATGYKLSSACKLWLAKQKVEGTDLKLG